MSAPRTRRPPARAPRPRTIAWVLLLLLGLLPVLAAVAGLAADRASGVPANHQVTFAKLAGITAGSGGFGTWLRCMRRRRGGQGGGDGMRASCAPVSGAGGR
jgi:hypothetical protein